MKNIITSRKNKTNIDMNSSSTEKVIKKKKSNFSFLAFLQKIGKSLVFPIAVLPAAALFLRIGDAILSAGSLGADASTWNEFVYWFGWILKTPGAIVFDNLPAIFGVGVAFGFAKDHRGEAALVGLIGYFGIVALVQTEGSLTTLMYGNVMTKDIWVQNADGTYTLETYSTVLYLITTWTNPITGTGVPIEIGQATWLMNLGVFGGIGTGLLAAVLYNKYSDIQLPKALGFFSGRRFVPMAMLVSIVIVSLLVAVIWPWFQYGLVMLSKALLFSPSLGAGVYVTVNRLLIPTGLHQILNTFLWFQMPILSAGGDQIFMLIDGDWVPLLGDINAFINATSDITLATSDTLGMGGVTGDAAYELLQGAKVGTFQTGFFPTMMFGLPAVGAAIAYNADKENRNQVAMFMLSAGLVSFITGITEPLEFSFMFVSPMLYLAYSVLSGVFAALSVATGASIGFGFSAGVIDFALSAKISSELSQGISAYANGYGGIINITIIGLIAIPAFFFMSHFMIKFMNLATPGRGGNLAGISSDNETEQPSKAILDGKDKWFIMAVDTLNLVDKDNITDIDNCITRVRLTVKNNEHIQQTDAQKIGYTGMFKPGKNAVQFVIGAESEIIAKNMKEIVSNYDKYKEYFEKDNIEKDNANVVSNDDKQDESKNETNKNDNIDAGSINDKQDALNDTMIKDNIGSKEIEVFINDDENQTEEINPSLEEIFLNENNDKDKN